MDLQKRHLTQEESCDLNLEDYVRMSQENVVEEGDCGTLLPGLGERTFGNRVVEKTAF